MVPLVLDTKRRRVEELEGCAGLLAKTTSCALVSVARLLRMSFDPGVALVGHGLVKRHGWI